MRRERRCAHDNCSISDGASSQMRRRPLTFCCTFNQYSARALSEQAPSVLAVFWRSRTTDCAAQPSGCLARDRSRKPPHACGVQPRRTPCLCLVTIQSGRRVACVARHARLQVDRGKTLLSCSASLARSGLRPPVLLRIASASWALALLPSSGRQGNVYGRCSV